MKTLVKSKPAPGLWLEEAPIPQTGNNDVLIKIKKTSICGTDVHIYQWDEWSRKTVTAPLVIGHEFVGEVAGIGENVHDVAVGEIVSGEGHVVCGRESTEYRDRLEENTRYFRKNMAGIGFGIFPGGHPIVPVMLKDALLSQQISAYLLELGIYVIGFFYSVVPEGKARIRTQISAAHRREDLDRALEAFAQAYRHFVKPIPA